MPQKLHRFLPGAIALLFAALSASSAPVDAEAARKSAERWSVRRHHARKGALRAGRMPHRVRTFRAGGADAFHVVDFAGGGFAVVPADDRLAPIIAFSDSGSLKEDPKNPLWRLLNVDLPRRMRCVKDGGADSPQSTESAAARDSVFDVRIEPLLRTHWGQDGSIFNALTPSNYPCGCVATSGAQVMRYFRHPSVTVEPRTFGCWVDSRENADSPTDWTMIGGVYDWANMPSEPDDPSNVERMAIGTLCYDVGVASCMNWCSDTSLACEGVLAISLTNVFRYASAKWYKFWAVEENRARNPTAEEIERTIFANLDARTPVVLSVKLDSEDGHSLLADGYGVADGLFYTHLNFGWEGASDAWYLLPSESDSSGGIALLKGVIFNISPTEDGEIISGRVVDGTGQPVSRAEIRATDGREVRAVRADRRGIYALRVPAGTEWSVWGQVGGYVSATNVVSVGVSESMVLNRVGSITYDFNEQTGSIGNNWGNDLRFAENVPPPGFMLILQ